MSAFAASKGCRGINRRSGARGRFLGGPPRSAPLDWKECQPAPSQARFFFLPGWRRQTELVDILRREEDLGKIGFFARPHAPAGLGEVAAVQYNQSFRKAVPEFKQ